LSYARVCAAERSQTLLLLDDGWVL